MLRHPSLQDARFQFTHPGRGATYMHPHALPLALVSIHAPREGCDILHHVQKLNHNVFQFTHPGRGATLPRSQMP